MQMTLVNIKRQIRNRKPAAFEEKKWHSQRAFNAAYIAGYHKGFIAKSKDGEFHTPAGISEQELVRDGWLKKPRKIVKKQYHFP